MPGAFGGAGGVGLVATGGFGLLAIGGADGLISSELEGREAGAEALGIFFHGVDDPFEGPMPGKTATSLLDASADTDPAKGFGAATDAGRLGGGGGAGAGAALGGTTSR